MWDRIYPYADYKFHITASLEERLERRLRQGGNIEAMLQRESIDEVRLKIPDDAIIIDTTGKTKEESFHEIISCLKFVP